jgi:ribonuclease inhibitor
MNYITLDFAGINTLWKLHEHLRSTFQLPEYYGRNMDALWDCLHCAFDAPTTIILKNLDQIPSAMQEAAETMLKLFRDLEREDEEVTVIVETDDDILDTSDYMI